jgi:hypothetical protein
MFGVEYPAWLGITPAMVGLNSFTWTGNRGIQSAGAPGTRGAQASSALPQSVTADPATHVAGTAWSASISAQGVLDGAVSLGLQLRSSGGMSTICNGISRFRQALPGLMVLGPRLSRGGRCDVKVAAMNVAAARPTPTSASHPWPRSRPVTQRRIGAQPAGAALTGSRERVATASQVGE